MAEAPIPPTEWFKLHTHAQLLPLSRFGIRHQATQSELLFFRGIAGENVKYIGPWGGDVILSGYCSQENQTTSDQNIFEMLWNPSQTALTTGTDEEIKSRIRYNNPEGFSGSLVWNTRFVEKGCDFSSWDPEEAVVTGLLRRYDPTTNTLLVWRVEHLRNWLGI